MGTLYNCNIGNFFIGDFIECSVVEFLIKQDVNKQIKNF